MSLGVMLGRDGNERRTLWPLARILTELPPMSITSTLFATDFSATVVRFRRTVPRWSLNTDLAATALARSVKDRAFGPDHGHQIVPRVNERPGAFVLKLD